MNEAQATLLRKAAAAAEEHPDEFDMDCWVQASTESWCGTIGCLAYEICRVSGYEGKELLALTGSGETVRNLAIRLLQKEGPGELQGSQIDQMFGRARWPEEAHLTYQHVAKEKGVKQMVELFIAGDGSFNPPVIKQEAEEILTRTASQPSYLEADETAPELTP